MLERLIELVENNTDLEFYGIYHGYCSHEGIAFTAESASALFELGALIGENNEDGIFDHLIMDTPVCDTLGRGVIISFSLINFEDHEIQEVREGDYDY